MLQRPASLFDDHPAHGAVGVEIPKGKVMTVCVAARAGNSIVLASDRMLTAGDYQYEPAKQKIIRITSSIFLLTAGDSSFLATIIPELLLIVQNAIEENPSEWMSVKAVADAYVNCVVQEKALRAERALLFPLGLNRSTFVQNQQTMNADLVRRLAMGMIDYSIPDVEVIIAGRDNEGARLYHVDVTHVYALQDVGFASIGSGARHANSQFMLAKHAWHSSVPDALFLAYLAKRRSEAAPGVGIETDMVLIGPELGESTTVGDHVIARLKLEYEKIVTSENELLMSAKVNISGFVNELTSATTAVVAEDQGVPAATNQDQATDLSHEEPG